MKNYIINVILDISIIGFLIFSCSYFHECKENMKITTAIDEVQIEINGLMNKPIKDKNGVDQILPKYQSLYSKNRDMIGFIYLDDNHRFPILQRIDDQNFYLDHDFFGNENSSGSIFANTKCHLGSSGITLIYGHHIKNNQMFSCLDSFKNKDFFENAEPIQIDTLYSEDLYQVAAVAICNMSDNFKYYEYTGNLSEGAFKLWKYNMSEKILWGSIKNLSYEDTIVELSTCSYEEE